MESFYTTTLLGVIASLPCIVLLSILRSIVFGYRSLRKDHKMFVFYSLLSVIFMLGIMAFVVVVLFGYGVAHSGKNTSNDFIVLAITVLPTYIGAFIIWRLTVCAEGTLNS